MYVDDHAPQLDKKLESARRAWVKDFWSRSGLSAKKAVVAGDEAGDQPLYVDDVGAVLTVEEAAALRKIVAALTGDGYSQVLYDEMSLAIEAGWISGAQIVKEAGQIDAAFGDVPPTETLDALKQQADAFGFMVNQREQQALYDLIDTAISDGQTVKTLTGAISDTFAAGYHVTDAAGDVVERIPTDSWSEMVARTELSRAQTMGMRAVYESAGIQKVVWQCNHGATVCDYCDEADGDVVALGDVFDAVDVDAPPAHPRCCCAILPADEDVRSPLVDYNDDAGDDG